MKCSLCDKSFEQWQGRTRTRCGSCNTRIRRYRNKVAALMLLGGKCRNCGFTGDPAAFDFHHKDPSQKDFVIGNVANKSWESIKKEILKCEILCRNCHSIHHSADRNDKFLKEVRSYQGINQDLIDCWFYSDEVE